MCRKILNVIGARGYEEFDEQPERLMNELERSCPEGYFFTDDISGRPYADACREEVFKCGALGRSAGYEAEGTSASDFLGKYPQKAFSKKGK